jgi:hypothetical protein
MFRVNEFKPFWLAMGFMCALGAAAGFLLNVVDASGSVAAIVFVGCCAVAGLLGSQVAHVMSNPPVRRRP